MYNLLVALAIVLFIAVGTYISTKRQESCEASATLDLSSDEITSDDIKRFFAGYDDHDYGFPCEANDKFYVLGYNSSKNFSAEIVEKFEDLSSKLR